MPPGYGHLTRHLSRRATHTWLSGSASRQARPDARNGEETRLYAQIYKCLGPDSHNEHTPALKVPLQMELRFHPRRYEQPPTLEGLRDDKFQVARRRPLRQQRQRPPSRAARELQQRLQGKRCGEKALAHEGREPAIQARETEVQRCGRSWRSRRRRNLLRLLPPQHQRRRPPVRQHRTSKRRTPQSAPAGPHSRPRRGRPRTRAPPSRRTTCWATLWHGCRREEDLDVAGPYAARPPPR
jgi:hypothetical protein